jgi:transcriptional regulator with XRE-family HTH domain
VPGDPPWSRYADGRYSPRRIYATDTVALRPRVLERWAAPIRTRLSLLFGANMSVTAPHLRKPIFGAYQPDASGKCATCGRHRHLCSASCRLVARRLRSPPKRRVRHTPPAEPACDITDLSPATRQLIMIGEALYGENWRRAVARQLGVDPSRIRRWLRGHGRPTIPQIIRLLEVANERREAILRAYNDVLHQLPGRPATRDDFPPVERGPPPSKPHLTLWQPGLRSR